MLKSSIKDKLASNTSEHVAAAGSTDSNFEFKWSDDLVEDLLKTLSNFKTVMEFQKLEIVYLM